MLFDVFLLCFPVAIAYAGAQRIADRNVTIIEQYPFVVSLLTNKQSNTFEQACGGVILTPYVILSAASCFFTDGVADAVSSWQVRVGSSNSSTGGSVYSLNQITTHPKFSTYTIDNDLAIVRVSRQMSLYIDVRPGSIAGASYNLETNSTVWAVGWGASCDTGSSSNDLKRVQLSIMNQQTCTNRSYLQNFIVTGNMVCTIGAGISGQCPCDAGSPLVQNGIVVGVLSHAESCGDAWYPSINTRVSEYWTWIWTTAILP